MSGSVLNQCGSATLPTIPYSNQSFQCPHLIIPPDLLPAPGGRGSYGRGRLLLSGLTGLKKQQYPLLWFHKASRNYILKRQQKIVKTISTHTKSTVCFLRPSKKRWIKVTVPLTKRTNKMGTLAWLWREKKIGVQICRFMQLFPQAIKEDRYIRVRIIQEKYVYQIRNHPSQ